MEGKKIRCCSCKVWSPLFKLLWHIADRYIYIYIYVCVCVCVCTRACVFKYYFGILVGYNSTHLNMIFEVCVHKPPPQNRRVGTFRKVRNQSNIALLGPKYTNGQVYVYVLYIKRKCS